MIRAIVAVKVVVFLRAAGMHLTAAIFVAASESQGEAYWRFHGFTTALRGLWLGSSSFPLLRSGCACFQERSKSLESCRRFRV